MDNETDGLALALKGIGGIHHVNKRNRKSTKNQSRDVDISKFAAEQGSASRAVQPNDLVVDLETDQEFEETLLKRKRKLKQVHNFTAAGNQSGGLSSFGSGPVLGVKFGVSGPPILPRKDKGKFIECGAKDYAKVMDELPSDSDWKQLERSGYNSVMKEVVFGWGELGSKLAGAYTLASNGLKKMDESRSALNKSKEKLKRIVHLEKQVVGF